MPAPTQRVTLRMLYDAYEQHAGDKPTKTQNRILDVAAQLITHTGESLPVQEVQPQHLRALLDALRTDYADSTTLLYYRHARTFLHFAAYAFPDVLDDYRAPQINLKRLPERLHAKPRTRLLQRDELLKVFQAMNAQRRYDHERYEVWQWRLQHGVDVLAAQFLTLKRRSELCGLQWSDVFFESSLLRFDLKKTKREQLMPMSTGMRELLERRKAAGHAQPFPPETYTRMEKLYRRISRAAGVPYGDRKPGGWVPHDLRRTAATWAIREGAAPATVAFLLGHQVATGATAVYTALSDKDTAQALEIISNLWLALCRDNDGTITQKAVKKRQSETNKKAA